MQITGGTIISSNVTTVYNSGGEMSISGNTSIEYDGDSRMAVNNTGTMSINENVSIVTSYVTINNRGTMDITGGNIVSETSNVINNINDGNLTISGEATMEGRGTESPTVANTKGTVEITGGEFNSLQSNAVYNVEGTLKINGGTYTANNANVISNKATMSIAGYPTIQNLSKPLIANRETGILTISQLNLDGGTSNAIANYGQLEINEETTIINNASNLPTIYNYEGSSIVVNAGTITNNGGGYAVYRKSTDISITISPNANVSKYN